MTDFFIDIETIPSQDPLFKLALADEIQEERDNLVVPSSYTGKKRDEWLEKKNSELDLALDKRYRDTSLDGAKGEIIVISFALLDGPVHHVKRSHDEDEGDFLCRFFVLIKDLLINNFIDTEGAELSSGTRKQAALRSLAETRWVGHRVLDFDIRFLYQRCVILGVAPLVPLPHDAYSTNDKRVYDTSAEWAGHRNRISLKNLCSALDLDAKGSELGDEEIDGSMVWDFYQAGRLDDIAKYCDGDVDRVRMAFCKMNFLPMATKG